MSDPELKGMRIVPSTFGPLRGADISARLTGPCGDTMEIWLQLRDGMIARATYTTDGCGHSVLCGSAAIGLIYGRSIREAKELTQQKVLDVLGDVPEDSKHCALLAVNTLKTALALYEQKAAPKDTRKSEPAPSEDSIWKKEQKPFSKIGKTLLVMSGKGGVGKSTVAVNIAAALAHAGKKVGLLDADIHGPSVPTMLGLEGAKTTGHDGMIYPIVRNGIAVMSMGFFLDDLKDPVIWRGPMKMNVIKQFITEVAWGELDVLVVDLPPGTGDEPLSVCQLIGKVDGAVIVTTPQRVAAVDVMKSVSFCRELNVPVVGVVENMSGFVCPKCGETTDIFMSDGGRRLAAEMQIPFLGAVPIDPLIVRSGDGGYPLTDIDQNNETHRRFSDIVSGIEQFLSKKEE